MKQYHEKQVGNVLAEAGILGIRIVLRSQSIACDRRQRNIPLSAQVSSLRKADVRIWGSLDVMLHVELALAPLLVELPDKL